MIIDGKKISSEFLENLKQQITKSLTLGAVMIGDNSAVQSFIKVKEKAAQTLGVDFKILNIPASADIDEIRNKITNFSETVDGLFIELPIPEGLLVQDILDLVSENKDVDVLCQSSQQAFYSGDFSLLPPAVGALKIALDYHGINIAGKIVSVFGQGLLVGKPISFWLEQEDAHVHRIDENTKDAKDLALQSDIIISGVGKPGLITGDMIKEGAIVIDFGYSNKDGKIAGDADYDPVSQKASLITPVPGGMGPLVVAALFDNLVK